MISILRQNQRILMLVVAVLTIIAFVWLYNPTELNKIGANHIASIYDKKLSQADIDKEVRNYSLAIALGQYSLLSELGGTAANEQQALEEFVWNIQVMQHQAKQLGVEPTSNQITDAIKTLPVFQTSGQFDYQKYATFVQDQLGPRGFTEAQLESVIRDSLRLDRIKNVVSAPATVSDAEVNETLRAYQKEDLQIARFTPVDPSTITVADDEIQKFFEANKAQLLNPETRSVKYVEFALPADKAAATGKDKVDALNIVAEAAASFAEKATSASFDSAAQAAGLTVQTSPQFDRTGSPQFSAQLNQQAPAANADLPGLAPTAFLLGKDTPVSDVVQSGDKFFVLHIDQITPESPMTLEQVRPMIESSLRSDKVAKATREKAEEIVAKIRDAVTGGRSFADTATAEGLKVETVSGFEPATQAQENKVPMEIVRLSLLLEPAQMSGYVPDASGGSTFFVAARQPLTLAGDELTKQKETVSQDLLEGKRRILFLSWLASARDDAKITIVPRNQQ